MKKIILIILTAGLLINHVIAQKSHSNIIDVLEYSIVLDISDIENSFIQGFTDVRLVPVQENTEVIYLDLQNLTVDSITCEAFKIALFTHNDTLISIYLANSISPEDEITLRVYYHGNPQKDPSGWGGFYFSGGYAYNLGVGFEDIPHNYGRVWFPCNDDFVDRAIYNTIITTKPEHTAVCAGELIEVTQDPESLKKTYFWRIEETIPTYLASVAVGNYRLLSHSYSGLERDFPVEFYIYPTDSAKTAQSFKNIDTVISIFETLYGPYRWNRVGFVSVPFNSGAMEHATNIAMGRAFIDGSLSYEDLFYHELAHMWFGDLITCSTAEDMWINEGWAKYSETIYREFLYGIENSKNFRRANHETVLRYYHIPDGGFLALFPMSLENTYARTVYQKGASVAHALRGYLGDELFFAAVKDFLSQFAFEAVSSYDMRDFFSDHSGIDLTGFFDEWVFTPGFVHYSIDSTNILQNGANYEISVYVKQKLRGRTEFANSNKLEISFFDSDFNMITQTIEFDGEYGHQTFSIPFYPSLILCDYNEKLSDATIDETKIFSTTGTKTYGYTYFKANVQTIDGDNLLRVTHNWAAPDTFKNQIPGLKIADHRFWTIEGILDDSFKSRGEFTYSNAANSGSLGYLDNDFITNSLDSIVLLYRPNRATDWTIEPSSNQTILKRLSVDSLKLGEYTLGIYDWTYFYNVENKIVENKISVYPNPNAGQFYINLNTQFEGKINIFDINGKLVYEINITEKETIIEIKVADLPDGLYVLKAIDNDKLIYSRKFVVQK